MTNAVPLPFIPPTTQKPFSISVGFVLGEANTLEGALEALMTNVNKRVAKENGYNPQALFPVAVTDDGSFYYAYQQWKWYTDIPEQVQEG
jgi:hypothetical protein